MRRVHGRGEASPGNLLASLFLRRIKYLTPLIVYLSTMPVKKASLELHNPVTSAEKNYLIL